MPTFDKPELEPQTVPQQISVQIAALADSAEAARRDAAQRLGPYLPNLPPEEEMDHAQESWPDYWSALRTEIERAAVAVEYIRTMLARAQL